MKLLMKRIEFRAFHVVVFLCSVIWYSVATAQESETLFYPPFPDAPRVQYLTSFSVATDVEEAKKKSGWLSDFVLGEETPEDDEGPSKPYGISLKDGVIHVVDTRGAGYAMFDLPEKDYRFRFGSGSAYMPKPINIEVDDEGNKYVADTERNQVLVFDRADEFITAFGQRGQFRPTDMLVEGNNLYVVDIKGHRIVVLDRTTGNELSSFGSPGSDDENFFQPTNIAMGPDKHLYISDTGNFRVQKYTLEGQFVQTYGAGVGTSPGNFARPKGVAVDRDGRVYVVDAAYERVQVFSNEGRLLMYFGEPGATHRSGLDLPTDIDIDYGSVPYFEQYADPEFELEFIIVVANQFGLTKVNVFGFGRHKSMSYDEE